MDDSTLDQLNEYLQQEYPGPYSIILENTELKIKPNDSPEGFAWFLSSDF